MEQDAAAAGTGRSIQPNETQEGSVSALRGRGRPPTSNNPRNVGCSPATKVTKTVSKKTAAPAPAPVAAAPAPVAAAPVEAGTEAVASVQDDVKSMFTQANTVRETVGALEGSDDPKDGMWINVEPLKANRKAGKNRVMCEAGKNSVLTLFFVNLPDSVCIMCFVLTNVLFLSCVCVMCEAGKNSVKLLFSVNLPDSVFNMCLY